MDPRRLLIPALAGLGLSACATLNDTAPSDALELFASGLPAAEAPETSSPARKALAPSAPGKRSVPYARAVAASPAPGSWSPVRDPEPRTAPTGIVPRGGAGPEPDGDAVVGEVQLFDWRPGRVYPVRTAPLRVTTLTLGPGETLVAKAAGDTVRWQIGETSSGEGPATRAHVLIKPLERGLETNLVLTTSGRVYLVDLSSGGVDDFNAAVAWDVGALEAPPAPASREPVRIADPVVTPEGPIDARYRIEPQGRRARWTPTAVFNDGRRTFVAFDPELRLDEAPALFVVGGDGEAQMVNYRQAGGLFIVDRVVEQAELRLGDRRPQVVRIRRLPGEGR